LISSNLPFLSRESDGGTITLNYPHSLKGCSVPTFSADFLPNIKLLSWVLSKGATTQLGAAPQPENIPWWSKNILRGGQTSDWGSKMYRNNKIINNSDNFRGSRLLPGRLSPPELRPRGRKLNQGLTERSWSPLKRRFHPLSGQSSQQIIQL